MGMFDYVVCEPPLPDLAQGEWQTKDFDCNMQTVRITKDGRLLLDFGRYEHVPENQRPYPNGEGFLRFRGCLKWVPDVREHPFHGVFEFYGHDAGGDWHEYTAKFTDGILVSIVKTNAPSLDRT